jgi:hypothetical protein
MKEPLISIISLVTMVFAGLIPFGATCVADNTVKGINQSQDSSKSKQAEVAVRYERKTTWKDSPVNGTSSTVFRPMSDS